MKSKFSKRILTMLLCAGMIFFGTGAYSSVHAADGDGIMTNITPGASGVCKVKSINVGANAMKINAGGWDKTKGQYLYYGSYDGQPVKYRVLDRYNGTSNTKFNDGTATMKTDAGDYLLLDSDIVLFTDQFNSTKPWNHDYSVSDIIPYLKDGKGVTGKSLFSSKEIAAIADTYLLASTETYKGGDVFKDFGVKDANKSFPLSMAEIFQLYNGDQSRIKTHNGKAGYWWSRSAKANNVDDAGFISSTGVSETCNGVRSDNGIAPASNLDLSSVIFTSAGEMTKDSSLTKVSASKSSEWKVTLRDITKSVQTTGTVNRTGQTVSVPYQYAGDGVDQISIAIVSGDITAKNSTVLYYGKLADGTDKSGTGSFELPKGLPSGYKAYILAEGVNEWKMTDYASEPVEITIPKTDEDKASFDVEFDSKDGTSIETQTITEGEKVKEPVEPTRDGYVFAGWYSDAACTKAYDFSEVVTEDITLYARWTAPETISSIDRSYTATDDETSVAGNEKDADQKNFQKSDGSSKDIFTYKAAEWTDKASGKARITLSTKNKVSDQKGALYAFTKSDSWGFSSDIASRNVKALVEKYGSVDVVIADGRSQKDAVIIENIKSTDQEEIKKLLEKRASFAGSVSYNVALYYGMCTYFKNHNPYVVYVSFDSGISDTKSIVPRGTNDIWDKLKDYKKNGRYFSMGASFSAVGKVTSKNTEAAIRAGLADPSVFVSMDSMTTTADADTDFKYKDNFKTIDYPTVTVTDTVDDRFEITKAAANKKDAALDKQGQTVTVEFTNLDFDQVGEVYIDIQLKDTNDTNSVNKWIETNNGNAAVQYTDQNSKKKTDLVKSPKLYYEVLSSDKAFTITTEAVNGRIDGKSEVPEGDNKTVYYTANKGYKLKSITVDGENVERTKYPDSYTFTNVTENHNIKVVFEVDASAGVKTGDSTNIILWIILIATSLALLSAVVFFKKGKKR